MLRRFKNNGFSLTEVLLAAGILAVGFMLVATTFPVGIKLTMVATERTIAAVTTDEALAKMNIYGVDPNVLLYDSLRPFAGNVILPSRYTALASVLTPQEIEALLDAESLYPSTEAADMDSEPQKYHWSALLRRSGVDSAQAVVFVSRKAGAGVRYPNPAAPELVDPTDPTTTIDWPEPIEVRRVDTGLVPPPPVKQILIDPADEQLAKFIADGAEIVDDETGLRMQVLRREKVVDTEAYFRKLVLSEAVDETQLGSSFWVIPVGLGSSRDPCVTVEVWDL